MPMTANVYVFGNRRVQGHPRTRSAHHHGHRHDGGHALGASKHLRKRTSEDSSAPHDGIACQRLLRGSMKYRAESSSQSATAVLNHVRSDTRAADTRWKPLTITGAPFRPARRLLTSSAWTHHGGIGAATGHQLDLCGPLVTSMSVPSATTASKAVRAAQSHAASR